MLEAVRSFFLDYTGLDVSAIGTLATLNSVWAVISSLEQRGWNLYLVQCKKSNIGTQPESHSSERGLTLIVRPALPVTYTSRIAVLSQHGYSKLGQAV